MNMVAEVMTVDNMLVVLVGFLMVVMVAVELMSIVAMVR